MERKTLIIVVLIALLIIAGFFVWQFFAGEEVIVSNTPQPIATSTTPSEQVVESTDAYEIEVRYPTTGTPEAEQVADFIQREMESFVSQAERDVPELRDIGFSGTYALHLDYNVYEVGGITSYVVDEYQYTGGANGIATLHTFVFDASGEELELEDAVAAENREGLVSVVQSKLEEKGGFPDIIAELTFTDFTTFYVTDTELVIGFSEYEVAPGAAGIVEVRVPREEYITL
jgi:hypothetical protein